MNQPKNQPSAQSGGRKFRNDLIFITVLLAAAALAGLAFLLLRGDGDTVTVTVDGQPYGTYPLAEDRTVDIRTGEQEEELNRLVIRDGKARVETATCPDGICAAHKPISRDGESIVCLPHKVVITVHRAEQGSEPDVVG